MFELFQTHDALWLLWLIPVLLSVFYIASKLRQKAMSRFADSGLLQKLSRVDHSIGRWKVVLILLGIIALVTGLARPAWGEKEVSVERRGRDVVFILDVSRSMLARDAGSKGPTRLERSKIAIKDCVNRLEGDRVGLVVFAGAAVVRCPLTTDYGFFRLMLDDVSPQSVGKGGTMIGDAIRKCVKDVFDNQKRDFRDIVLITDGEDHESFPTKAAEEAGQMNVRLIAIGIGDENEGRRILVRNRQGGGVFLKNSSGQFVETKLNAQVLRQMVNSTPGGKYLNVATGTIDLGQVYLDMIASADRKKLEKEDIIQKHERFQIFLILGLIALLVEPIIGVKMRKTVANDTA